MIWAVARLCIVAIAAAVVQPAAPSYASGTVTSYVSAAGNDNNLANGCTGTQPCANLSTAFDNGPGGPQRMICVGGSGLSASGFTYGIPNQFLEIDCPQGYAANLGIQAGPVTVRIRHLTFWNSGSGQSLFTLTGSSGTIVFDDCVFTDASLDGLDIEPSGALNLVIRNSRILNGGSGILLKPAAGGSLNVTLDHVTIANNTGGGLKIDTTNGPATVDINDSVVSGNGGNGINAVGNAGSQAIVNIKNSVIAKNGAAGVQANGANAGVVLQTTLLDQNAAGATSVASGGHISTYGNNSITGSAGSGFTGSATPQ
jgi:hypothetical protein